MNAPVLSFVPAPTEPHSPTERLIAHGELTVAADAFGHAVEAMRSAAYFFERAAQRGGGYASDVERVERHRELLREATLKIDAGLAELANRPGRRA
ncbi:hypothetical protein ACFQE0_26110 [Methylobacterium komagatae]|uniref:Uncharacterized protein n=1 Tax=Methylobacterium komagatae TaxID=374425 RepID=A0ABW2BQG7_9HYPH